MPTMSADAAGRDLQAYSQTTRVVRLEQKKIGELHPPTPTFTGILRYKILHD